MLAVPILLAFLLFPGVSSAQSSAGKEPPELDRIRREYLQRRADAIKPIAATYQAQLESLLKKLTQNNDLEGALTIRRELDSLREGGALEIPGDLQKAILENKWSWTNKAGEKGVKMTFKDDGTVSHIGMHGTWDITGPRDVTIAISDRSKVVLRFDTNLTSYNQVGGAIRGRRW